MNIFLLLVLIKFIFCKHNNYRTYFTCYFNKYNNIENSTLTNLERDGFVLYVVNESVGAGYDMQKMVQFVLVSVMLILESQVPPTTVWTGCAMNKFSGFVPWRIPLRLSLTTPLKTLPYLHGPSVFVMTEKNF